VKKLVSHSPKDSREGVVNMTTTNHNVLAQAEKLGEALQLAKDEMDYGDFYSLLDECNTTIKEITRIDYGTICAPAGGCGCGGKC